VPALFRLCNLGIALINIYEMIESFLYSERYKSQSERLEYSVPVLTTYIPAQNIQTNNLNMFFNAAILTTIIAALTAVASASPAPVRLLSCTSVYSTHHQL